MNTVLNAENFKIESRANLESGEGKTPGSSPRIFDVYYNEKEDQRLEIFKEANGSLKVVFEDYYFFDDSKQNEESEFINKLQSN